MYRQVLSLALILTAFLAVGAGAPRTRCLNSVPAGQTSETDETTRAITLFEQGATDEAISKLRELVERNKRNLRAWHYLGLAFEKKGDVDEAKRAHERSARLGDQLLNTTVDEVAGFTDFFAQVRPIATQLIEAGESARRFLLLTNKPSRSTRLEWQERADSLRSLAEMATAQDDNSTVFKAIEVDVKARIINKPPPSYTEEARRLHVTGRIVIDAILGANGKVLALRPLNSLAGGLTAQALRAARDIRFEPAMKDGKPVSMAVKLEYGFYVY